jgi:hypothetical protein
MIGVHLSWHTLASARDHQSDSRNQHAHGDDCHEAQPRLFPPRSSAGILFGFVPELNEWYHAVNEQQRITISL